MSQPSFIQNKTMSTLKKDIHHVHTNWNGKMNFSSTLDEHTITMDKLEQHGGDNLGARPKAFILSALSGCTGMEIIAILEKMRLKIEGLSIEVFGELTDTIPKMYKSVHITFTVKAENPDKEKIERAINLAVDKYCGVVAMVRKFATLSSEINYTT
jgi:putative redox protein